jgi:predicted nucleic acid-binding Zn ribbon protein
LIRFFWCFMSFNSLPQLLNTISNQESWRGRKQFQQLLACWFDVVGAVVAAQTRPIVIQRRVLQVATSSSVWAQNLAFERHRILEKLNARLELGLTDIRFSTANWQADSSRSRVENFSETVILWREHPSLVTSNRYRLPRQPQSRDPQTAFLNWARAVRAQSQHLPLCPTCHSPTPEGELIRWSICALCAAQQFGQMNQPRLPQSLPQSFVVQSQIPVQPQTPQTPISQPLTIAPDP